MCIFSSNIRSVSATRIFARRSENGGQFLAYSMTYTADRELAMILPLPVPASSPDDAIRFIDLSDYSDFFDDLYCGFPPMRSIAPTQGNLLKVYEVGSFEASFVPSRNHFIRLDSRFRLPDNVWDRLPQYNDYGFAVFKLKAGEKNVHPMAFEFPRRDRATLFFPTLHVHRKEVEPTAEFNHILYKQSQHKPKLSADWEISSSSYPSRVLAAKEFVDIPKTQGIIEPEMPIEKGVLDGVYVNQDVVVRDVN
ncbi:hypothetical protein IQ249_12710 [Lusitaniella coriacea LEGE 07157]|uniref:Uncharacterized protein n=1 Tax=Lusitaniella coriacea LEGE 07157 TaxID=945747 RepID=A0A8J7DX24_9CYAN|nr:hypothetical protein [Lusitaniella coriacea]MBE9116761.1 hypothetical protein [Lusitaniella coriacea LEGE 07157]